MPRPRRRHPLPSAPSSVETALGTPSRRAFLGYFAAAGLAATALPELLWAEAAKGRIRRKDLVRAEKLAGLELTDDERDLMLEDLDDLLTSYENLRQVKVANAVPPALVFQPLLPGHPLPGPAPASHRETTPPDLEDPERDLPFATIRQLGELLRRREVTSVELTERYLERLKELGPVLECVVTLTEERALGEADRADRELASGRDRGPLHGIPWGAKDLLAATGYPTTWGAAPYRDQVIDHDATVVRRLTDAGGVLAAKLTLGALAWGDVWFGGKTRNPWNLEQGSSGSSAGSAAATAAGLVGYAIGSETWGSIVSPSTRCGTTGLRPTFGHVSRHGAMALSWSMDKLGPICRSVDDCALVLEAIHGPDGEDPTVLPVPFRRRPDLDPTELTIGYLESAFDEEREDDEWRSFDLRTLEQLESMGCRLRPIELPDLPVDALSFILSAEAAAAFDELTRDGRDDELVRQVKDAWPNVFRQARFIPAVEYLQANRVRTLLMREMAALMESVDLYVTPSYGGSNLLLTNLTGHPAVVLPNGFRDDGTPTSITFTGRLFGEAELVAVAGAYQDATDFHRRHPEVEVAEPETPEPAPGRLLFR